MVNYGFILVPLYIYPLPGAWDQLFQAAKTYPEVTFQAVINPDTGPSGPCPNSDYINATAYLNKYSNIQTLAYVHTAAQYDCGAEADYICPCTQPLSALRSNITDYQNWNIHGKCTKQDIHLDGIFFDEAPSDGNCSSYMSNATSFARSTLTRGSTVLFNAGEAVDSTYWSIADYINVFEDTEAAYDTADIGALDGEGKYHGQTTMIIHSYTDGADIVARDVNTILNVTNDAMAGLYITDLDVYSEFPTNWMGFVGQVAKVVEKNSGLE
ncbi:hypothetical protein EJ03DRAFT_321482 [Teratosphaeria nubilosa]|uniref:Uncharacterized protein n=1 Tax=Teratosphaeria nubilosa TaxID=161662 RepID=A0A6G1KVB5_9PEZI|nr:hypothetical protein EJ03DRAFT_321482 [Teratosphaeria nubilosa]